MTKMEAFDEKLITLNDGKKDLNVLVYLKEVAVKSNHTKTKAFCRITGEK
ncbi:MAG: hypothetical protein QF917_05665 [Candidatus Woesearchaeota archaeon]|nr:hypothetical protein [Candidatus Woesearchaeota archaeon]